MTPIVVLKMAVYVALAGVFAIGVVVGVRIPSREAPARTQIEPGHNVTIRPPTPTVTETATVTAAPAAATETATATASSVETAFLPVPGVTATVPAPGPTTAPTAAPIPAPTPTPGPTRTPKNRANGIDCFVLVEVDHGILIKTPCRH